jgi:hypothetical protein
MNPKKKLYYPLCQLNLFFKRKIVILLSQYNINISGYKIKKTEAFFFYIYIMPGMDFLFWGGVPPVT